MTIKDIIEKLEGDKKVPDKEDYIERAIMIYIDYLLKWIKIKLEEKEEK